MAATKTVPLQIAPKITSDSSENAYNLEVSDESSCNSDVDILDLIRETARDPENSLSDKDILRSDKCKESYRTVPPTLHNLSFDDSNSNSKTDLKSNTLGMTCTAIFDVCNLNQFNSNNENLSVTDFEIDDLLSTLNESETFSKSSNECIDSTLLDFLVETEHKGELIELHRNEVSAGSHQEKSLDTKCEQVSSLSLAALAECHFRENHLGNSVADNTHVLPSEVSSKSCFFPFEDNKRDCKKTVPCKKGYEISLSSLAESYLVSETGSNPSSSQTISKKNVSKEVDDLDISAFIDSINTETECVSLTACSREKLNFSAKEKEFSELSELLEIDDNVDEGYDSGKLSPGIDLNKCIKKPNFSPQHVKKPTVNDDHCVLLPQYSINQGFADVLISNPVKENTLNLIPKPTVINTKQSLFAKVLTCKSLSRNTAAALKVSNIKKDLFEKYFCATEENILCNVQDSKKVVDKSRDGIIQAGYLHYPSLPLTKC